MTVGAYKGMNYKQRDDIPPTTVMANMSGKEVTMIDSREVDATTGLATNTLTFFKPPRGSRLIAGSLLAEAMASGGTLSVGTGATTWARKAVNNTTNPFESVDYTDKTSAVAVVDNFLAATVHTSAARTELLPVGKIDKLGYEFDGDTTVTVTGATADMVDGARVTMILKLLMP